MFTRYKKEVNDTKSFLFDIGIQPSYCLSILSLLVAMAIKVWEGEVDSLLSLL